MGVLGIVDWVVFAVAGGQIKVEVEVGVAVPFSEEISDGVFADFGNEFPVGDGFASTLGHLDLSAVFVDTDDLVDVGFIGVW